MTGNSRIMDEISLMAQNPYDILGISKDAAEVEIKSISDFICLA